MHQVVGKIKQGYRNVALSGALTLIAIAAVFSPGLQAQQVSEADVQAALKRCGQCHGPTLQMSKLDLSTREGMLKGGKRALLLSRAMLRLARSIAVFPASRRPPCQCRRFRR